MKTLSAVVATILVGIAPATAGTGKQAYDVPSGLPPGQTVQPLAHGVQAFGAGAAIATNFLISTNQAGKFYAGIWYVNADGTLDESMAPGGVFIHPDEVRISYDGFDFAFNKLAMTGQVGPSGAQHTFFQTFPALEPGEEDPPVLDVAGGSLDHHTASNRFVMIKNMPAPIYFAIAVTNPSGALDPTFNGTGLVNANLVSTGVLVRFAPDGSIVMASSLWSYFGGTTVTLRRYSSTGTLLASGSTNIGGSAVTGFVIDSSGRPLIGTALLTFGSGKQATVRRFTTNLQPDSSFGTGGSASFTFLAAPGASYCNSCNGGYLALQSNGKIIVGGWRENYASLVVGRVNTNGTLDTTFGTSGAQYITFSGATMVDGGLVDVNASDGIFITGRSFQWNHANEDTLLAKLTANGALDTSFGSTP